MSDLWPREGIGFYDAPIHYYFSNPVADQPTVIPVDIDRRVLVLSGDGSHTALFMPDADTGPPFGIPLTTSNAYIVLTWDQHGPLVTVQWQCNLPVGGKAYAISFSMPRNPNLAGYDAYQEPANGHWFNDPRYRPRRPMPRGIMPGSARRLREILESYRA